MIERDGVKNVFKLLIFGLVKQGVKMFKIFSLIEDVLEAFIVNTSVF